MYTTELEVSIPQRESYLPGSQPVVSIVLATEPFIRRIGKPRELMPDHCREGTTIGITQDQRREAVKVLGDDNKAPLRKVPLTDHQRGMLVLQLGLDLQSNERPLVCARRTGALV
jgi:hypothetical protein